MIYIIRERATKQQLQEMMEILETYIKLAVDVERGILAGGGAMHADWNPDTQETTFESLINIRPRQNNRSLELQDPDLRAQVEQIARNLLGDL